MKLSLTTIIAKWHTKSAINILGGLCLVWGLAGCAAAPLSGALQNRTEVAATAAPTGQTVVLDAPSGSTPDDAVPPQASPLEQPATPRELSPTPTRTTPGEHSSDTAPGLLLPTPTPVAAGDQAALAITLPEPTPAAPAARIEPTPDGLLRTVRVPILMYHYLSTPPPDADIYRTDLSVSPDLFTAHLDRLLAEGYTTISLYDLQAFLTQGAPLPEKPVILTFDDGYRDNYEHAFPLLKERGMTATFFVVTDFIDEERPAYLTWDMAREMLAGGMSIESHGRNHVSLKDKDPDYLVWQALGSLETIQYELGVRPRFVSYPAGEFDPLTIDIFQSANYWAGLTTVQGATHSSADPFRLTRVRIRNTTTPADLARLLNMDW